METTGKYEISQTTFRMTTNLPTSAGHGSSPNHNDLITATRDGMSSSSNGTAQSPTGPQTTISPSREMQNQTSHRYLFSLHRVTVGGQGQETIHGVGQPLSSASCRLEFVLS